ncbi:endonuclease domain-containing 1 protein-like [Puntigrus tetrazona]|uniref:endonuclease domain-containing 1 protein-like n=1 Tax=Puntigrus tetrazona TaxID=1606681 RepID=UPI001C898661|nr:endonuclease domain-containing 1 protein-like [Puntigrus tetrazona]XP_043098129.1 endonuclease domain-containing 1 protein-like [Puntigrus tetrazona]
MMFLLRALMLSLLFGASAKVVQDFQKECGQFFANGRSPTIFPEPQYKQICQTLNGNCYYATLYDTSKKIPVYSAYKFEGVMGCTRTDTWYVEPQIDDITKGGNMDFSRTVYIQQRGLYQAVNSDYEGSGYDRGHLAPVYLANSQSCADATFTLTNAAPQTKCFNRIFWFEKEQSLANKLKKDCFSQQVYIVTGVVPGTTNIANRVNVPSYFWTAYCCLDNNKRCSISGGFIGSNENDSKIREMNVADLQRELTKLYGKTFQF